MTVVEILLTVAFIGLAVLSCAVCYLYQRLRDVHRQLHFLRAANQEFVDSISRVSRWTCAGRAIDRRRHEADMIICRSQHGEELAAWELLGETMTGFYVEIGAYDGIRLSNTAFFEQLGWTGVLVEAHPELAQRCRENRPKSHTINAALGDGTTGPTVTFSMVRGAGGLDTLSFADAAEADLIRIQREGGAVEQIEVPARTLAQILDERQPPEIDFVSIDVEGAELSVLKGAALDRYPPRLIVIEDNSDGRDPRVADFLRSHQYRKVRRVGCNDFYLRSTAVAATATQNA